MKCSVSHGPARNRASLSARLRVVAAIAGLSLPLLAGCPGSLEGNWPPPGMMGSGSGGATGSGGNTGTGGGGTGTGGASMACDAPAMYLQKSTAGGCAATGCHASGSSAPNLGSGDIWTTLTMGKAAAGTCAGQPFVNASKPPGGVLLKRLMGTECGLMMPLGASPPGDPALVDCVTSWINSKLP